MEFGAQLIPGGVRVRKKKSHLLRSPRLWGSAACVVLILVYFVYRQHSLPKQITSDVFSVLEKNGYVLNPGFSGLFRAGNLIQVTELGTDGHEHLLPSPLLFAWSDECFPGQAPRSEEFTIPEGTGTLSTSLTLSGTSLFRAMPALNLQSEAVANYSLNLKNARVQAFAKGDLSGGFSPACVEKLKRAIRAGDKVEWFKAILATVVTDELTLRIQWKEDSSADAKGRATELAKNALADTQADTHAGPENRNAGSGIKVGIVNNSKTETTISANGVVIIGYQARPIQPSVSQ